MDRRRTALTFTSLGHFSNDFSSLLFPVLITYFLTIPGISILFLGVMAFMYNILSGLLGVPVSRIADRSEAEGKLMAIGILIIGASAVFFASAFFYQHLAYLLIFAGTIVFGLGRAFYHPIGASILQREYGPEKSPEVMGVNGSFGSIGRAIMPTVLIAAVGFAGLFNGMLLVAYFYFACGIIIFLGLRHMRSVARNAAKRKEGKRMAGKKTDFRRYYAFLAAFVGIVFVRSMFIEGVMTFTPEYVIGLFGSEVLMGVLLTVGFFAAIFGQIFFGVVTSRKGGLFGFSASAVLALVAFVLFMLSGKLFIMDVISYAIFVFGAFNGFPVLLGYVGQVIPAEYSTRANSLVWNIGNTIGGSAGIGVFTVLLYYVSIGTGMWVMVALAFISALMLPLLAWAANDV